MAELPSTKQLVNDIEYVSGIDEFFAAFSDAWGATTGQVLKLETRQIYKEPGNASLGAFLEGDVPLAIARLPDYRKGDLELYADLERRNIEFIRCRPIVQPITEYLRWELECYRFNAKHGEKIYFLDRTDIFDTLALHDFIVFDRSVAVIHDYNEDGLMKGGWVTREEEKIDALASIFALVRVSAVSWMDYNLA